MLGLVEYSKNIPKFAILIKTMKTEIAENYQNHQAFIKSVPERMACGEGEVLYHARNEVRRLNHEGQVFIVKQFKRVNAIQQVIYTFFRPTKAARAYRFAEEFRKRGITTPREIAYIETAEHGLFTTGYFISEEARGRETHLDLREVKDFDTALADAVARQVVLMHSKGILHGDLNLSNFLYERQADGQFSFVMIDINRSHFTDGWPTDDQCLRNMVRMTHRRDLYTYLVRSYAEIRGWDAETTVSKALQLLHQFEHRRVK